MTTPGIRCGNAAPHGRHEWYGTPAAIRRDCPGVVVSPSTPRVIGLDLSLTATGIASSLGWCQSLGEGGITTRPLSQRIDALDALTRDILIAIGGGRGNWPALVVIETPAYSRTGGGAHERSGLWWQVVRALSHRDVPIAEVSIPHRMRYATGKGSASKGAVIDAVARRLPMFETGGDDNCADAAVLAAMGADHLGAPLAAMPAAHRKALDAVQWPEVARPVVAPHEEPVLCRGCHACSDDPARPVAARYLPTAAAPEGIEDIALPGLEVA